MTEKTGDTYGTITVPLAIALDKAWSAIQAQHPDVPEIVLTIGAGSMGVAPGTLKLGHFANDRWKRGTERLPELFVGGEGLARGGRATLTTLLHEATHALAMVRKIKDTSRQGRYHNRKFADLGATLGLIVREAGNIGWSDTTLTDAAATTYADTITMLDAAIIATRYDERGGSLLGPDKDGDQDGDSDSDGDGDDAPKAPSRNVAAICGCAKPRRFRIARSVLALAPITCSTCEQDFRADEEGAAEDPDADA